MTLIISKRDVDEIVERTRGAVLDDVIERVRCGYIEMSKGTALQHPRIYLRNAAQEADRRRPHGLFSMSAVLPELGYTATRLHPFGDVPKAGEGVIVLFDYASAKCSCVIDDSTLHGYRTGAPAAVATTFLARPDSEVIGCIGSGAIAAGGLQMTLRSLSNVKLVRVYSPNEDNRRRFAETMGAELGVRIEAVSSAEQALEAADVVVTATTADSPVVPDSAIQRGTHLNLLARNEIELVTFERARVVRGSALAGKALDPPWKYTIPDEWIDCELTDIVAGSAPPRTSADEATVFIGSGPLAMWDVAAASAFYEAARGIGLGQEVQIG